MVHPLSSIVWDLAHAMRLLFVVFKFARFTLSAEMQVDFAVFKFVERVYNSEFILFHADEKRNIYFKGKISIVHSLMLFKGPFTQAIFVPATRCNFCRAEVASSFKHVRKPCDIAATNRTENRTWFTRAILKLQLSRQKNCIELPRQKSPVLTFVSLKNKPARCILTYFAPCLCRARFILTPHTACTFLLLI